jgi:hypothetical protein
MVGIQKTKNEEQEWNPAFARLTKAGHPSASSGAGIYTVSEPVELTGAIFLLTSWPSAAHTSGSVSVHFRVLPWQFLFFDLNIR